MERDNYDFLVEVANNMAGRIPADRRDAETIYNSYIEIMLILYTSAGMVLRGVRFDRKLHNINTCFRTDLRMSTLDIYRFIRLIEQALGLYIPKDTIFDMLSVRDLCVLIAECYANPEKYKQQNAIKPGHIIDTSIINRYADQMVYLTQQHMDDIGR